MNPIGIENKRRLGPVHHVAAWCLPVSMNGRTQIDKSLFGLYGMRDFWIYFFVKHLIRIVPWLAFVGLAIAQGTSPVDAALLNLTSQDLNTRERAFSALLAQSEINAQSGYSIRVRVNSLLRTHPQKPNKSRSP